MGTRGWAPIAALALTAALGAAPPAGAATPVGQTSPVPPGGCLPSTSNAQVTITSGTSYEVPAPGVITSWSHMPSNSPGSGRLQVWRPQGGPTFTLVGRSELTSFTAGALNTFEITIPVLAGDVLGFRVGPGGAGCDIPGGTGFLNRDMSGSVDPVPGELRNLTNIDGSRLNVAAILEPDCDGDGLGDETRDEDLLSCPPGPAVTITGAPKDRVRTKKKKKRVTFDFVANEPATGFTCVLDGKQEFKACTSPLTITVKKGEHTFSVTATDAGGNAGAAATDTFKVKRKKKR